MVRNAFVTALIVVLLVGVSAGAAFAAGQARGERTGMAKGREEAIAQLQSQFDQASEQAQGQASREEAVRAVPLGTFPGRGGIAGIVESVSENSIVIRLPQGGTRTMTIGPQTAVQKLASGAQSDITPGARVMVGLGSDATGPAATVTILSSSAP